MDHAFNKNPQLITPHLPELIDNLIVANQHNSILRTQFRDF